MATSQIPGTPPGSLQSKVSQYRDASGQVQETSQEELRTLAGKAGLPAQPTNAVAAGMIGANADQQKMAAAPQTVQSALQLSQVPVQDNLATAQREKQAQSTQTQADKAEAAKARQLQGLGDTSKRVQSAIDAAVNNITAKATKTVPVAAPVVDTTSALFQSAGARTGKLTTDLQALQAHPNDRAVLARINQDLGRDVTSQITPAELQSLYQTADTTITSNVASQMPDNITVGQIARQPGFQYSMDQLGTLLGVAPKDLQGFSMAQLSQAVAAEQQKEFSRAQQADAMATSQYLGTAERGQAQAQGRDLAAQGVRATEADVSRLQQSVANGDKVQFGGQTYSVEDLLGNGQVSKTVSDYLMSPEGSPTRLQLEHTEPGLVKYIKDHETVLSDAAQTMSRSTQGLASTQAKNATVGLHGTQKLDDTTLKAIIPGYDPSKISAGGYNTSSPVLQFLSSLPADKAEVATGVINGLSPSQKQELAGLSPKELAAMQLDKGQGSPVLQALAANKAAQAQLSSISPKNADQVYAAYLGIPGATAASAQAQIDDLRKASSLGLTPYNHAGGLDMNDDGKLDDPSKVFSQMQKQAGNLSIADAEKGKTGTFQTISPQAYNDAKQTPDQAAVYSKLQPYLTGGKVDTGILKKSGVLGDEELVHDLVSTGMIKNLAPEAQKSVQDAIKSFQVKNGNTLFQKYPTVDKLPTVINKFLSNAQPASDLSHLSDQLEASYKNLTAEAKTYGSRVDAQSIQARVAALKDQMDQVHRAEADLATRQGKTAKAKSIAEAAAAAKKIEQESKARVEAQKSQGTAAKAAAPTPIYTQVSSGAGRSNYVAPVVPTSIGRMGGPR